MLEKALRSIEGYEGRRVVIGALTQHLHQMGGASAIRRALGEAVEIVEFEETTKGPAMTVAEMIRLQSVVGAIFIKDCDSWFDVPLNPFDNSVCIVDLRHAPNTRNIPGKSFIVMNENLIVEGIREKYICSPYISVGGYGFSDAANFMEWYGYLSQDKTDAEPFISHVIMEGIRQGAVFKGVVVSDYHDVGTLEAWREFRESSSLYLIDIDGVVFRNAGQYSPPLWEDDDVPLPKNVERIKQLIAAGGQVIFVTSRPERFRKKTEAALRAAGLSWHAAIFGVLHSRRILVNDFAPSNPFPSAVAINIVRNGDDISSFL